jgi:hypothetical protein
MDPSKLHTMNGLRTSLLGPFLKINVEMAYVEKHFSLRVHRRNGTSKLLLGITGSPPRIGSIKQVRVAKDEVLVVRIVKHPNTDEPAEGIEVSQSPSPAFL